MAAIVNFEPESLRIVPIDPGSGDISLSVKEIYSEWKEWVKQGDNAKYPIAFRVVGGDPLTDTKNLGSTFFLINNWRIRPFERAHKLTLVGNIFTDPSGFSVSVPTFGNFRVHVETEVSNLSDVNVVDSSGQDAATLTQILANTKLAIALIASK